MNAGLRLFGWMLPFVLAGCGEPGPLSPLISTSIVVVDTDSGLVLLGDSLPVEGHGSHQVIVTQNGGVECRKTTFKSAAPQGSFIHPEDGCLIEGSNARFPGWRTITHSTAVTNWPSASCGAATAEESYREAIYRCNQQGAGRCGQPRVAWNDQRNGATIRKFFGSAGSFDWVTSMPAVARAGTVPRRAT